MENAHFSHFGVKEEYQDEYPKRVEPCNQARVDGYFFGDRMLEGVKFIATIQEDGTISVAVDPQHEDYFNQLNTQMWLDKALEHVLKNDAFERMIDGRLYDVGLVMDDGRYNYEWG